MTGKASFLPYYGKQLPEPLLSYDESVRIFG